MPYQMFEVKTSVPESQRIPFDEWFDSLPINYFENNPNSLGKNKFELFDDIVEWEPPTQITRDDEIKVDYAEPTVAVTQETDANGVVHTTTISTWENKAAYDRYIQFKGIIYTHQDDINDQLALLATGGMPDPGHGLIINQVTNQYEAASEFKVRIKDNYGLDWRDYTGNVYYRWTVPKPLVLFDEYNGMYESTTLSFLET